jgi:hypothetical protein
MVDETDPTNGNVVSVAGMIVTGNVKDGTKKNWMLEELCSEQLQAVVKNMECANIGSVSKFVVRKEIARQVFMGSIYKNRETPTQSVPPRADFLTLCFTLSIDVS